MPTGAFGFGLRLCAFVS